jgi:hypothetical protein
MRTLSFNIPLHQTLGKSRFFDRCGSSVYQLPVVFGMRQRVATAERADCHNALVKFLQHPSAEESPIFVLNHTFSPSLCAFCLIFPARSGEKAPS